MLIDKKCEFVFNGTVHSFLTNRCKHSAHKKTLIASTSSPAKYSLKKTTVPFQYWHFQKTLSTIVSKMLTMPLMYLELLSIYSIFTLPFLFFRVLRSQGKPVTRKRCVLFLCSDGCCCDGIKIKALRSPPEANLSNDS